MAFPGVGKNWLDEYYKFNLAKLERDLSEKNENFWLKAGQQKALKLFHAAAERVPAYKDFLKQNKIDNKKIVSISDFKQVPLTDKKNYIAKYPLKSRVWDGQPQENKIIASSSGTTGNPNY